MRSTCFVILEQSDDRLDHPANVGHRDKSAQACVRKAARAIFGAHAGATGCKGLDDLHGRAAYSGQGVEREGALGEEFADILAVLEDADAGLRKSTVAGHGLGRPVATKHQQIRTGYCSLDRRVRNAEKMADAVEILSVTKRSHEQELRRVRGRMLVDLDAGTVGDAHRARVGDHAAVLGRANRYRVESLQYVRLKARAATGSLKSAGS